MVSQELAVRCAGCGRVYHLPAPVLKQRAKCRGCGHEFRVADAVVPRPVTRRPAKHQGIGERTIAAMLAANLATVRDSESVWKTVLQADSGRRYGVLAAALLGIGLTAAALLGPSMLARKTVPAAQPARVGRLAKLAAASADSPFANVSDLIRAVEPAVVQIETRTSIGSGFVLDPAGLIVTCLHCVEEDPWARVVFANGQVRQVEGVRAISAGRDLVILQVPAPRPLPALLLAETAPSKREPIVSFGSPAGLSFTVSEGSISAVRTVSDVERIAAKLRGRGRMDLSLDCGLLQFTATSMPGNSGGPAGPARITRQARRTSAS